MNTYTNTLVAIAAIGALSLGACGKDENKAAGGAASKTVDSPPAALKTAVVESLAVSVEIPEDATVSDNTKSAGFPTATIYASPTFFIRAKSDMFWKKDLAAQKAEIEKDPANAFKKFSKEEVTEGGFHLEYEMTSMMESPLYGFHIRTTIAGTEFDCTSNASSPAEREAGVAMCKSMKAK